MGTINKKLFILVVVFSFLGLSSCDISKTNDVVENEPDLEEFANSETFKNLAQTTKEVIKVQSDHFQSIASNKKSAYIDELNNLTQILKEDPSKENLKKFVDHTGFNNLDEFMNLYKAQKNAKEQLSEEFPGYANLNDDEKSVFLKEAAMKSSGNNINIVSSSSNCAAELEAKRGSIESQAYLELLGCGAAGAGATSLLGPLAGGVVYGACAGAVYEKRASDLELAQIEYERCIQDQQ